MDFLCLKLSSGVSVAVDLKNSFNSFKRYNNPNKFVICKIVNKKVIVEEVQSTENNFQVFLNKLPADDCRYAIYKIDFNTLDERPHEKLIFIAWVPDTATVRNKMLYASSKLTLTKELLGIPVMINATCKSDLSASILRERCRKFT